MSISFIFWLLMFLWLISGIFYWRAGPQFPWSLHAWQLLTFILLFLVGWKLFGFPIQG